MPEHADSTRRDDDSEEDGDESRGARIQRTVDVLTHSFLRISLGLFGLLLLLFALGQAFGLDLLGILSEFLETQTGRWLVVAVFALVLVLFALRGWSYTR